MKIVKNIIIIFVCILPFLLEFIPLEARAGGRTKPEKNELQRSILFTAWYRDKVIQVAIANLGDKAHSLKVAIGTSDVRDHLFASQSLLLPPQSIKLVYFPLLTQKGPKGERNISDHVFVLDGASSSLVGLAPVQQLGGSFSPSLEDFLVTPGDSVQLQYRIDPRNSRRIFFLPREVKVQDKILTAVEPEEGFRKPIDRSALKKVNLPASYQPKILQMVEGNFCFLVSSGERAEITLRYTVPEIKNCAVVRLSETQYEFQPNGGVGYGTGAGLVFMIYNPKTIKLTPLLDLSREEEGSITRKSIGTK
jgi:hypothetical protein